MANSIKFETCPKCGAALASETAKQIRENPLEFVCPKDKTRRIMEKAPEVVQAPEEVADSKPTQEELDALRNTYPLQDLMTIKQPQTR